MRSTLYTLLLVAIVAASSWAAFGLSGLLIATLACILALLIKATKSILNALLHLAAIVLVVALLLPMVSCAREAARRMTCYNNMRQISLSLWNYHEKYKCFPPAYVADRDGKPMHSWRVLILPFMERQSLYDKYLFEEPWNGPNNKCFANEKQWIFECPSDKTRWCADSPYTDTNYLAIVGPNAAWLGERPRCLGDPALRGKEHSTVLIVESNNIDIRWTEPRDMAVDTAAANAQPVASSCHMRDADNYFLCDSPMAYAAMADCSVRPIPLGLPADSPVFQIGGCTDEALQDLWERSINWPHCIGLPVFLLSVSLLVYQSIRCRRRQ